MCLLGDTESNGGLSEYEDASFPSDEDEVDEDEVDEDEVEEDEVEEDAVEEEECEELFDSLGSSTSEHSRDRRLLPTGTS